MSSQTASGPHNSLMSGVAVTTARGLGEHAACLPLSPTGGGAWSPPPQHTPNVGGNDTALPGHRAELRRKYPSPRSQDEGINTTSRVSCAGPGTPAGARRGTSLSPRPTQETGKWSRREKGPVPPGSSTTQTATHGVGSDPGAFSDRAAMGHSPRLGSK